MYADFSYYAGTFYGTIVKEEDWPKYASKASDFIDYYTWGAAKDNAELPEVKKCCCALAEQYNMIESVKTAATAKLTEDGIIASETVGSHSRSFRSGVDGAQAIREAENQLPNIAKQYLLPTGMLYRGVRNCVHSARRNAI